MKKNIPLLFFALLMAFSINTKSQVIFNETFGQTTTRQTSPYMPSGGFIYADPNGNNNQKWIENNHYAVIAPANIRDAWPLPQWWWWTGPEPIGNTWGGANNPATNDHTGNANGAVMVVNAGTTLNPVYARYATLVPGNCYRFSVWFYLVNANSQISLEVKEPNTGTILGSVTTPFLATEDAWQEYTFDFKYPSNCNASNQVQLYIMNRYSANGGNDYYIDDVSLTTVSCVAQSSITCSNVSILPLKLINFNAKVLDNNIVGINWETATESNINKYVVQKSMDGVNFIDAVNVNPTNTNSYLYNAIDEIKTSTAEKIYYRLKIIENNGIVNYSKIVIVNLSKPNNMVMAYPQPGVNGLVKLNWQKKGIYNIELFSTNGSSLQKWVNYSFNNLQLSNLKAGFYTVKFVEVNNPSNSFTKKVVIAN